MGRESSKKQPLRYDTERLDAIPIEDVLEALGSERIGNTKKFKCFNKDAHKAGDKSASMSIHPKENYCNCFGCNTGGSPVALVTSKMGGDFKDACEWLHDTFHIPFRNGDEEAIYTQPSINQKREPEYIQFNPSKAFNSVHVKEWIPHYLKLNDERRLKLIYSMIYRYSLTTDQRPKTLYHAGRGIDSDHPMLLKIGYLSSNDLKQVGNMLKATFPKEDLIRFNLFSPADQEYNPQTWKYWSKTGFCVVPSFDLYSDMCNGFILRNTDANLDKRRPKEIQVSRPDISFPLPFGLTRELLLSDPSLPIYGNEGYIDGLSLGKEKLFVAATGVHGLKEKMFCLLKGREFRLAFDMDNAGIRAVNGYFTVSVKKSISDKNRVSTKYFHNTTKGILQKDRYLSALKKYTNTSVSNRFHEGLVDSMKKVGVNSIPLSWDTKINTQKFVTDINEILKEYRMIYHKGLTGKKVDEAVCELRQFYKQEGNEKQHLVIK